jgi:multidrug transporter EmrE-like cation transporter
MPRRSLVFANFLALLAAGACAQTPATLNLSHDLTTYGIAGSNMAPSTPTLDSTPLFQAGVAYAVKDGIATVTVDRGSYYFLSQDQTFAHLFFQALSNLTIDLQ